MWRALSLSLFRRHQPKSVAADLNGKAGTLRMFTCVECAVVPCVHQRAQCCVDVLAHSRCVCVCVRVCYGVTHTRKHTLGKQMRTRGQSVVVVRGAR